MNKQQLFPDTDRSARAIGPIGTWARLLLGAGTLAVLFLGPAGDPPNAWQIALGLIGFTAVMVGWQTGYGRVTGKRLKATGPLGYLLPTAVGVGLLMYPPTMPSFAIFIAASMLLSALRGYAGCEITAISNWVLRRDDQVGCVLLSPLDHAERRQPAAGR